MERRQLYLKSIAITLVIVVLFQNFNSIFNIAEFVINRSYYAQYECIYRDNPDVMCNAQCVLDQILDADQGTSKTTLDAPKTFVKKYVVEESFYSNSMIEEFQNSKTSKIILDNYSFLFEFQMLKPPIYT